MLKYLCDRCAPTTLPPGVSLSPEVMGTLQELQDNGFERVLLQPIDFDDDGITKTDWYFVLFCAEYGILATLETYREGETVNRLSAYFNWACSARMKHVAVSFTMAVSHTISDAGLYWNPDGTPHHLPSDIADSEPDFGSNYERYLKEMALWRGKRDAYLDMHPEVLRIYAAERYGDPSPQSMISDLLAGGHFLKKWVSAPQLWLVNFQEAKADKNRISSEHWERIIADKIAFLPEDVQEAINYGKSIVPAARHTGPAT